VAKKCYYKPNRSKPRYFNPCAVARCAVNCVRDTPEYTAIITLACVARNLGFEYICLPTELIEPAKKYKKAIDIKAAVEKADEIIRDLQEDGDPTNDGVEGLMGFVKPLPPVNPTQVEAEKVTQSVLERMLRGRKALIVAAAAAVAAALTNLLKSDDPPEEDECEDEEKERRCVLISEILPESMCCYYNRGPVL